MLESPQGRGLKSNRSLWAARATHQASTEIAPACRSAAATAPTVAPVVSDVVHDSDPQALE